MNIKEPEHPYLKSVVDSKRIHDNPLNNSPAKMQYTFPHANRFSIQHMKPTSNVPFYNITEKDPRKVFRTCSLGKGNKYDFTKNCKDVPAPNCYFPKNTTIGVDTKRGYSFGVSRDLIPHNSILYGTKVGGLKPGPGTYTPVLPKSGVTVTFRIKTGKERNENINIGPGKYDFNPSFEPCKRIFNSKFKSTKGIRFPPLREQSGNMATKVENNLNQSEFLQCDLKHQINKQGVFYNSKYHNSLCRSFGKADKESFKKGMLNPGPGAYVAPSEFGIYASSKFS